MPAAAAIIVTNILVRKGDNTFQVTSSTGEHGPSDYEDSIFCQHVVNGEEEEFVILCDGPDEDVEVYQLLPVEFNEEEDTYTDEALAAIVAAGESVGGADAASDLVEEVEEDEEEDEDDETESASDSADGGDDDSDDDADGDGESDEDEDGDGDEEAS